MTFLASAAVLASAALVADSGTDSTAFDANVVSPGVVGFIATAGVGLAIIFLGFDLVRRLRRSQFREQIREDLAAELAERGQAENIDGPAAPADGAARPSGAAGERGEPSA